MTKKKCIKLKSTKALFQKMRTNRKNHPVYYYFHDIYYRVYHFVDDIPLNIKSFLQRGKKGWSSRDTWGFSSYIANTIAEGVHHLKTFQHGHPADLTEGQWTDILNKIIDTFEMAKRISDGTLYLIEDKTKRKKWSKMLDGINKKYNSLDRCMTDNEFKRYDEGWKLFQQYFFSLWD